MTELGEQGAVSKSYLREVILGGQDGLVNVLGIVLAVAVATEDIKIIIISGLAATFAESISMGAVAYTSSKAVSDHYKKELERENSEIEHKPEEERREIEEIYKAKGFSGTLLNQIVTTITSNHKVWVDTMMKEELGLSPETEGSPLKNGIWVFVSAMIGSLIPLTPFFFMTIGPAIWSALGISAIVLFLAGMIKAKVTIGSPFREGLEMMIIGMFAALIGYAIGSLLGVAV